jgi:hypothetical protein
MGDAANGSARPASGVAAATAASTVTSRIDFLIVETPFVVEFVRLDRRDF